MILSLPGFFPFFDFLLFFFLASSVVVSAGAGVGGGVCFSLLIKYFTSRSKADVFSRTWATVTTIDSLKGCLSCFSIDSSNHRFVSVINFSRVVISTSVKICCPILDRFFMFSKKMELTFNMSLKLLTRSGLSLCSLTLSVNGFMDVLRRDSLLWKSSALAASDSYSSQSDVSVNTFVMDSRSESVEACSKSFSYNFILVSVMNDSKEFRMESLFNFSSSLALKSDNFFFDDSISLVSSSGKSMNTASCGNFSLMDLTLSSFLTSVFVAFTASVPLTSGSDVMFELLSAVGWSTVAFDESPSFRVVLTGTSVVSSTATFDSSGAGDPNNLPKVVPNFVRASFSAFSSAVSSTFSSNAASIRSKRMTPDSSSLKCALIPLDSLVSVECFAKISTIPLTLTLEMFCCPIKAMSDSDRNELRSA